MNIFLFSNFGVCFVQGEGICIEIAAEMSIKEGGVFCFVFQYNLEMAEDGQLIKEVVVPKEIILNMEKNKSSAFPEQTEYTLVCWNKQ
jgi:hypothetical protein